MPGFTGAKKTRRTAEAANISKDRAQGKAAIGKTASGLSKAGKTKLGKTKGVVTEDDLPSNGKSKGKMGLLGSKKPAREVEEPEGLEGAVNEVDAKVDKLTDLVSNMGAFLDKFAKETKDAQAAGSKKLSDLMKMVREATSGEAEEEEAEETPKRRGRPKKEKAEEAQEQETKRGRGRPPGTKNKPKAEPEEDEEDEEDEEEEAEEAPKKRGRGRPPGAKNKSKAAPVEEDEDEDEEDAEEDEDEDTEEDEEDESDLPESVQEEILEVLEQQDDPNVPAADVASLMGKNIRKFGKEYKHITDDMVLDFMKEQGYVTKSGKLKIK